MAAEVIDLVTRRGVELDEGLRQEVYAVVERSYRDQNIRTIQAQQSAIERLNATVSAIEDDLNVIKEPVRQWAEEKRQLVEDQRAVAKAELENTQERNKAAISWQGDIVTKVVIPGLVGLGGILSGAVGTYLATSGG